MTTEAVATPANTSYGVAYAEPSCWPAKTRAGCGQVKTRLNATPALLCGKTISTIAQPVTAPDLREDLSKSRVAV